MRAMPAGSCFHSRSVDLFHLVSPFLLLPDIVRFMPEWLALCDLGAPGWGEPWFPQKAGMAMFVCLFFCSVLSFLAAIQY